MNLSINYFLNKFSNISKQIMSVLALSCVMTFVGSASAQASEDELSFLDRRLKTWVIEGGPNEYTNFREVAAARILESFGKTNTDDEVTDMRFKPADLDLSNLHLSTLPEFCDLAPYQENLLSINLANNELMELPIQICSLKNLKFLCVAENGLTSIPDNIENLTHLTDLYIHGNNLISIPESIGNLNNLKQLYVQFNELTTLPESLQNLVLLQELDISNNQLTEVPYWIEFLVHLKYLNMEKNPFAE